MDEYKEGMGVKGGTNSSSLFNSQNLSDKEISQVDQIIESLKIALNDHSIENIFAILKELENEPNFINQNIEIFNESSFVSLLFNCLSIENEHIQLSALTIFNSFLDSQPSNANLDYIFSNEMMSLILSLFGSMDSRIKMESLSTICILSSHNSEKSFGFWDQVLSSLNEETCYLVSKYIVNEIAVCKSLQNMDIFADIFTRISNLIFHLDQNQDKFNSLMMIIIKFLKDPDLNLFFIQELIKEEWISIYMNMIHSKQSNLPIEVGFDVLRLIVPHLSEEQMKGYNIVDFELLSQYIDFDYHINLETNLAEYTQKFDVQLVKSVFNFLLSAFQNHPFLVPFLYEYVENDKNMTDFFTKILFIVPHSSFVICNIASEFICFVILHSSYEQTSSLSLDELIECMFSILSFDTSKFDIVYQCLYNIVIAFMNRGRSKDDLQEVFLENEASELFHSLLESNSDCEDRLAELCQLIEFDFDES